MESVQISTRGAQDTAKPFTAAQLFPEANSDLQELDLSKLLDPEQDCRAFAKETPPSVVTSADVIKQIKDVLADYIFVSNGLSKPFYSERSSAKLISKEAFVHQVTSKMPLKDNGRPYDPAIMDREHSICEVVDQLGYRPIPGLPLYTDAEQIIYANTYRQPSHPEHTPEMLAEVERRLTNHIKYLFGCHDRDSSGLILLSYLAHIVQEPSKPPLWAILLFGEAYGTGKTLILNIVRNAIGASNFKNFDSISLKEKFTTLGADGLLHAIEEVHLEGTSRWSLMNDLKPRITNKTVKVRKMYQDAFDLERYARIIATSNYSDALPVTEQDRRWCVLQTNGFTSTEEVNTFKASEVGALHYQQLVQLAEPEWGGAVLQFLRQYKINYEVFDPGRPPITEAKRMMAVASRSDDAFVLLEAIEAHACADITTDVMINMTRLKKLVDKSNKEIAVRDDWVNLPKRKALGYALRALGFLDKPHKFDFTDQGIRAKGSCYLHKDADPNPCFHREAFILAEKKQPPHVPDKTEEMFKTPGPF